VPSAMAGSSKVSTTLEGVRATVFPSAGLLDFSTLCAQAGVALIARPAMARTAAARMAASRRHPFRTTRAVQDMSCYAEGVPLDRRSATTAVATPAMPTTRPPMPRPRASGSVESVGLAAASPVVGAAAAS
jgi:hypothetical protein